MRLAGPMGTWTLEPGVWLIGRGEQCRIQVADPRLSRTHARLLVGADGATIEDQGSHNGVLVNGDRIAGPTSLADGDVVVCGPLVLVVDSGPGAADAPEPPRPAGYVRQRTEEMPPGDLAALAAAPRRTGSASRPMDPGIAAALSGDALPAAPPRGPQASTDRHAPSPMPESDGRMPNALTAHKLPVVRPPPSPATASDHLLPNEALREAASGAALEPGGATGPKPPPERWTRLLAGGLDIASALAAVAVLAPPLLVAGWTAGVLRAGAILGPGGLPELLPGGDAGAGAVAASLLHPGGLERAWNLTEALRQFDDRLPFLLVFLGATGALLATTLVLLLGLVATTVVSGGPAWHQRCGLKVVVARNGHHPGWLRASWRWLLVLLLWPLALPALVRGGRALHDLLSGCSLRRR